MYLNIIPRLVCLVMAASTSASTASTPSTLTNNDSSPANSFSTKHRGKKHGLNLYRLSQKLVDLDSSIKYCQQFGLLGKTAKCPTCKTTLERRYQIKRAGRTRKEHRFQCGKCKCRDKKKKIKFR